MSDDRAAGLSGAGPEPALAEASALEGSLGAGVSGRSLSGSMALGLLRAARPKQWFKNVLVLAAPGAAGVLLEPAVLAHVALGFVALCLVASGTYLLNDVADLEADRMHPTKCRRPIAAGVVPVPLAVVAGVAAMAAGFATAYAVGWVFLGVVAVYLVLTSSYTVWLKHLAVVDLAAVASFFILRAVAGGVAADVSISRWFLIVASFGSLFIVAGKRASEASDLGDARGEVRATLAAYSPGFLGHVWTMASGVTLTAYCLWAFEQSTEQGFPLYELSIVPFVLFVLRYALIVDAGKAGAPEDVVLGDRMLQLVGAAWVVVFGLAVYLGP